MSVSDDHNLSPMSKSNCDQDWVGAKCYRMDFRIGPLLHVSFPKFLFEVMYIFDPIWIYLYFLRNLCKYTFNPSFMFFLQLLALVLRTMLHWFFTRCDSQVSKLQENSRYLQSLTQGSRLWVCRVCHDTQILADQLTLFQPRGTDYDHLITSGTPGFADLPTALNYGLFPICDH